LEYRDHPAIEARAPADSPDELIDLQMEYESMLRRLCRLTHLPEADEPRVIESQALLLSDVPISFRLESWSGFVKMYADAGEPAPACAHDVYRTVLEQQLCLPAPFQVVVGLHSETNHIMLYACAPLSISSETDQNLLALLEACVVGVKLVRGEWADSEG
jgi:hypothetical protein